jgi:pimeloyl-ACP methyl ester carboxylesterase
LEAVLDRIVNTPFIDPSRVMLLGFSGGGAAAIRVAADRKEVYSLAVVGTPSDFQVFEKDPAEIITDFKERGIIRNPEFPSDIDRWMDEFRQIEPLRWIAHSKGKHVLIIHGDADELIPVDQARDLFKRSPAGISELLIISGGAHRLRLDPRCVDILKNWFLKTLGWKK